MKKEPKKLERVTRKKINEFLWKFCYKNKVDIPLTKNMFYTVEGHHYIGLDTVKWCIKHGITEEIQTFHEQKGGSICVGFCPNEQKWVGWSHRASTSFAIGYVFPKNHVNCTGGFTKPGTVLKTLDECKEQAMIFSECVS